MAMDLKNGTQANRGQKRFPLFDVVLLLLLVLAVVGFGYWAMNRQGPPEVELSYTVRFSGVDNAFSGNLAPERGLYTTAGEQMGTILNAEVSRAKELQFDELGAMGTEGPYRYEVTYSSVKSDVVLTVRVTAQARNGGYFVGNNRVAAGMEIRAMVNGYSGTGLILTVEEYTPAE